MKRLWWFLFVACLLLFSYSVVPGQKVNQKARLFDAYGAIGYEDVSARLDNFAIQLQNEPNVDGYVVGYGPERDGSGTGKHLLRVTKDYLVRTRGLGPERIQTIYGGRYKNPAEVLSELWLVPQGMPAPEPRRYRSKLEAITGKFAEYEAWDSFPDGDGPSFGNVTLAAFGDILRQQPKTFAYIVAFNVRGATPGTWRRVAKRDVTNLQGYGIEADRIKIIYGGIAKREKNKDAQRAIVQLWILPSDAPPPVKEVNSELAPKEAVQIGSYNDYILKYPDEERWIFEGFTDVLRANEQLSVCLIVRPRNAGREQYTGPDEPPDIDPVKLVEQWKSELTEKLGIKESRIIVIHAAADEYNGGTVDVWVVPPGAPLPDPYASYMDES